MGKFVLSRKGLASSKSSEMRKLMSGNRDVKRILSNLNKRQALFKELQPLGSGGGVTQGEFKKVLSRIRMGQVKGLNSQDGRRITNLARETKYFSAPLKEKPKNSLVSEKPQFDSVPSINSQKSAKLPQQSAVSFQLKDQTRQYINPQREARRTIADKASIKDVGDYTRTSKAKSVGTKENQITGDSDIEKLPG